MKLTPWDPWQELEQVRAETERIWDRFLQRLSGDREPDEPIAFLPDVDFVETRHDFRLYISAPGLVEEDIEIAIEDDTLTVQGVRLAPYDPNRVRCRLTEWRYGCFERTVKFPQSIAPNRLRATYEAGVLTIIVDKQVSD